MIFVAHAQWNPNTDQNLLVAKPGNGASFSATTSDGKTYIGYWKQVDTPANYELWLQILDQNGAKQLGNDGILLSNQIPMATYTIVSSMAVDASDNLYLAVTGSGAGNLGYVFKITPQGTSVWPNGISLGEAFLPKVLSLSNGDIALAYYPASQTHMKIQRFNSSGQSVWANPVEIAADDATKTTIPSGIFELSNNEIEVVFHKLTTGSLGYLYAQKLDSNGNILWTDGAKQIATQPTTFNSVFKGVVDGGTLYYGYTSSENNRFDSYIQRINNDGSLPWGNSGVDFDVNQTNFEKNMRIAFSPGSQYIWAIAEYTFSGQGAAGEYIQKFNKNTGARLFTDNAKEVFPINADKMVHEDDLLLIDDKPFFIVDKTITASILSESLNAVLLDENGNFAWPQQYIPVATYDKRKSYVNVLKPINNKSIIVFQEKKSTDSDDVIYAQSFTIPASNLGVSDVVKTKTVKLYPNPATNVIHIDGVEDCSFTIFNSVGQLVKSGKTKSGEIAVHELVKGDYILKLKDQEKSMKFIKK